jgi:3,4-dihydroxy 2-butanone 4-phosphate synthase/GTP cyclohydrolase II
MYKFDLVEDAIEDIRNGKMVIVADDESRENEGDFICAAESVTPEIISFMINHGRGLVCAPITDQRASELQLPLMLEKNTEYTGCSFLVSVDADPAFGVTTGISAHDRATTIRMLVDEERKPMDFRRPGHVFPLRARDGGVLERNGQTEAAVDLARLAGLKPAGVICEIIREDGFMARRDELFYIARKFNLRFITVAQMQAYLQRESQVWARPNHQMGMVYLSRPAVI